MKKSQSLTNYNRVLANRHSSPANTKLAKNILERSNIMNPRLSDTSSSMLHLHEKGLSDLQNLTKKPLLTHFASNSTYEKKLSQPVDLNKRPSITRNASYSTSQSDEKKINQSVELSKRPLISNSPISSSPKSSSNLENRSRPGSNISRTPQNSTSKSKNFSFEETPESKPSIFKNQSNLILNPIKPEEKKLNKAYQSSQSSKKCVICYNELINRSYSTPKCKKHTFCLTCIKGNQNAYKRLACTDCENFFEALNRKTEDKVMSCSLCKKFPEHKIIDCRAHEYCKDCLNFLISNTHEHIEKVNSCTECKKSIKKIVDSQKQYENHNKEIFTPRTLRSIGQATRRTEVVLPFVQPKAELDCYNPHSSRSIQKQKLNESANSMFAKKPEKNSIAEEVKQSGVHAVRKKKNKRTQEENADVKSYRAIGDCVKCAICGFNKDVKAFLCNHNVCLYCLVGCCCKSIMEFFVQYQVNNDIVRERFYYKCPFPKCENKISVPTLMILKRLDKFLDDCESKKYFESFAFLKQVEVVKPWIPYLDGFPYWSSFSIE